MKLYGIIFTEKWYPGLDDFEHELIQLILIRIAPIMISVLTLVISVPIVVRTYIGNQQKI